jgi:hypothetical protein
MLAESREETRLLREEVEEYRAAPHLRPISPNGVRPLTLSAELSQLRTSGIHSRTESSPMVGTYVDRLGWSRMSTSSSTGPWDHQRKSSLAPSLSSSAAGEGPYSPGLGMGQVGEYAGAVQREEGTLSPTIPSGRESPRPMFRASPSGGLGYVVNGIPKKSQRPGLQRSYSVDKRRSYFVCSLASWYLSLLTSHRVQTPLLKIRPIWNPRTSTPDPAHQLHPELLISQLPKRVVNVVPWSWPVDRQCLPTNHPPNRHSVSVMV